MSPVITMNCILALAERGYGENKGLATILCTAACIDVVHVISLFTISYSIVFANGTIFPLTTSYFAPFLFSNVPQQLFPTTVRYRDTLLSFSIFLRRLRANNRNRNIESTINDHRIQCEFQTSIEANGGIT